MIQDHVDAQVIVVACSTVPARASVVPVSAQPRPASPRPSDADSPRDPATLRESTRRRRSPRRPHRLANAGDAAVETPAGDPGTAVPAAAEQRVRARPRMSAHRPDDPAARARRGAIPASGSARPAGRSLPRTTARGPIGMTSSAPRRTCEPCWFHSDNCPESCAF